MLRAPVVNVLSFGQVQNKTEGGWGYGQGRDFDPIWGYFTPFYTPPGASSSLSMG